MRLWMMFVSMLLHAWFVRTKLFIVISPTPQLNYRPSAVIQNDQKYNSILTVVCQVIKYALFILIWDDTTAADFAKLFFEHIECCFSSSRSIVTDRNFCIISDFWWEVCEIKIIKQHLSTVHHSQTDDQSKALNQVIENYLQVYTSEDQTV